MRIALLYITLISSAIAGTPESIAKLSKPQLQTLFLRSILKGDIESLTVILDSRRSDIIIPSNMTSAMKSVIFSAFRLPAIGPLQFEERDYPAPGKEVRAMKALWFLQSRGIDVYDRFFMDDLMKLFENNIRESSYWPHGNSPMPAALNTLLEFLQAAESAGVNMDSWIEKHPILLGLVPRAASMISAKTEALVEFDPANHFSDGPTWAEALGARMPEPKTQRNVFLNDVAFFALVSNNVAALRAITDMDPSYLRTHEFYAPLQSGTIYSKNAVLIAAGARANASLGYMLKIYPHNHSSEQVESIVSNRHLSDDVIVKFVFSIDASQFEAARAKALSIAMYERRFSLATKLIEAGAVPSSASFSAAIQTDSCGKFPPLPYLKTLFESGARPLYNRDLDRHWEYLFSKWRDAEKEVSDVARNHIKFLIENGVPGWENVRIEVRKPKSLWLAIGIGKPTEWVDPFEASRRGNDSDLLNFLSKNCAKGIAQLSVAQ